MEQEFDLEYVVVEFIKDKSLTAIPENWLQENYAYLGGKSYLTGKCR